jgi:hypothetical protein
LQNGGNAVLTTASDYLDSTDIGVSVQGYDADTAKYDDVTANFTGSLKESGSSVVVQSDIGTAPNEIPLNQYLGALAYLNESQLVVNGGSY